MSTSDVIGGVLAILLVVAGLAAIGYQAWRWEDSRDREGEKDTQREHQRNHTHETHD
ncbi:hypothetical protein [Thioalkalivibrio sp. ALE23]|uniref:hypothetical protein n=1 Tax=Thioalkalivibrio sp. ALE23 TaxID=1265495 RepID=UPI00036D2A3F|nr:hypothetical protein [Thioalkalivibrio sp. ALE23]